MAKRGAKTPTKKATKKTTKKASGKKGKTAKSKQDPKWDVVIR